MSYVQTRRTPHHIRIYRNAAQSIPNITNTKVLLDTVQFDNGSLADVGNNRVIIRRDGLYLVQATMASWPAADGKYCSIAISKNSSNIKNDALNGARASERMFLSAIDEFYLSLGDTIEVSIYHDEGTSKEDASSAFSYAPTLRITELS